MEFAREQIEKTFFLQNVYRNPQKFHKIMRRRGLEVFSMHRGNAVLRKTSHSDYTSDGRKFRKSNRTILSDERIGEDVFCFFVSTRPAAKKAADVHFFGKSGNFYGIL